MSVSAFQSRQVAALLGYAFIEIRTRIAQLDYAAASDLTGRRLVSPKQAAAGDLVTNFDNVKTRACDPTFRSSETEISWIFAGLSFRG